LQRQDTLEQAIINQLLKVAAAATVHSVIGERLVRRVN
jgi:hypothetical protein